MILTAKQASMAWQTVNLISERLRSINQSINQSINKSLVLSMHLVVDLPAIRTDTVSR